MSAFWSIYIAITALVSGAAWLITMIKKLRERYKDYKIQSGIHVSSPSEYSETGVYSQHAEMDLNTKS